MATLGGQMPFPHPETAVHMRVGFYGFHQLCVLFVQFYIYVKGSAPHADQLVPT